MDAWVYICCSSCTCLFTVSEHIMHCLHHVKLTYLVTRLINASHSHAPVRTQVLTTNNDPNNKHKAGGLNDASHHLGQCKSFILVFVELFLLLTTCISFRFLCLDYDIADPLNDTVWVWYGVLRYLTWVNTTSVYSSCIWGVIRLIRGSRVWPTGYILRISCDYVTSTALLGSGTLHWHPHLFWHPL